MRDRKQGEKVVNNRVDLSVCMIVRDEAHQLDQALISFQRFADELVVVDTGSRDETREIASRYTNRVFEFPWCDDFSAARNFSFEKARGRYLLWLDADDRVDQDNARKITVLKKHLDDVSGYSFLLQDIRSGKFSHVLTQLRCVPNRPSVRFHGRVHERLDPSDWHGPARVVATDIVITHHGYNDIRSFRRKIQRNLRLLQKERADGRKDEQLFFYLALSYQYLGQSRQALEAMELARRRLELKMFTGSESERAGCLPFYREAVVFIAERHLELGELDSARRCLVKIQGVPELDPWSLFRIGCLHQKLGSHGEAVRFFRQVHLDEQRPQPLPTSRLKAHLLVAHTAYSLHRLGRDDAVFSLVACLERSADRCRAWESLALLAAREQRPDLVWEAFRQAFHEGELSPDGWVEYAMVLKGQGDMNSARECLERVLAKDPDHLDALVRLANLEWQHGNEDVAFERFREAVDKGSEEIPVLLAYAFLAAKANRGDDVERVRQRIGAWFGGEDEGAGGRDPFLLLAESLEHDNRQELAHLALRLAARGPLPESGKPDESGQGCKVIVKDGR